MTQRGVGFAAVLVIAVLLAAFVAVLIVSAARGSARRQSLLVAWAGAHCWRLVGAQADLVRRWRCTPFGVGDSRRVDELMVGEYRGRQCMSMRYSYWTGMRPRTQHTFHVVSLRLSAPLPWLSVDSRLAGGGAAEAGVLAGVAAGEGIRFESSAFNDAWRVQGPAGQYPYEVIHPGMVELLLRPATAAAASGFAIEGDDAYAYASTGGDPQLERTEFRLDHLMAFVDAIPQHVWDNAAQHPREAP